MAISFYPHDDDVESGTFEQKLDALLEAAERYKAIILETSTKESETPSATETKKRSVPRDIQHVYNWDKLAKVLRELRDLPETNAGSRLTKANNLTKLASIYEVLRGAKMPKLEGVRLALMNEANQLRASTAA